MKKINFFRVVWIFSMFLTLIIILVMVMDYKINYQNNTRKKIYFYDHDGILTVTEVSNDEYLEYSTYDCGYEECPIFTNELNDNYVILNENDTNILFDYKNGKVISNNYDDYKFLSNNYIIVIKNNLKGLINLDNEVMIKVDYDDLGYNKDNILFGYNLNYIIVKKNDKYGIISIKEEKIVEDIKYSEEEIESLITMISSGEYAD